MGDGDVTLGVELAAWAAPLFIGLSLLEECGRWCERALAGLDVAARDTRQEMILQEALALSLMYTSGNSDQVRVAIERRLALGEAFGDRRHNLQLPFGMHRLRMRLGDFRSALAVVRQSATLAETANDPAGLPISNFMLGTCYHFTGDQAAAQFTASVPWFAQPSPALRPPISSDTIIASTLPSASPVRCGCAVLPIRPAVSRKLPSGKR